MLFGCWGGRGGGGGWDDGVGFVEMNPLFQGMNAYGF